MAVKSGFKLKGVAAMRNKMRRVNNMIDDQVKAALWIEAEQIMMKSKRYFVPVDLGPLRASGYVKEPDRSGLDISEELGFGGASAPYALIQHESLEYKHKVGEAKYLEKPMQRNAKGMARRIAAKVGAPLS